MNIGIVTTWFERGAAYVSRQFEETLSQQHNVFIYARGGEADAKNDKNWDKENVTWGKKIFSPFLTTVMDKKDFVKWINRNKIEVVLFNEQQWWKPLLWCKELGVKTVCYVDYYKKETLHLFENYDLLICNTKRHLSAFDFMKEKTFYIPWGTNVDLYKPERTSIGDEVVFFHSCGMDPYRKGTDMVLNAFAKVQSPFKLIIHTQVPILETFPGLADTITLLEQQGKLEIIHKTVHAPGLFHLGDVYVYPSRLEGVGLTIAEALASGLACVVPDNGPMNEFVDESCGRLIKIEKQYCRWDAYYWPECESSLDDIENIVEALANDKPLVSEMKLNARKHATTHLNWQVNSKKIFDAFESLNVRKVQSGDSSISTYENTGKRKVINKMLKYQSFLSMFKKFFP